MLVAVRHLFLSEPKNSAQHRKHYFWHTPKDATVVSDVEMFQPVPAVLYLVDMLACVVQTRVAQNWNKRDCAAECVSRARWLYCILYSIIGSEVV